MPQRQFSAIDKIIIQFDKALTTILGQPMGTGRHYPAANTQEATLTDKARQHSIGLMRVNHAGEVSAQGLYQGQALTAKLPSVKASMQQAALEENDHLIWCQQRLIQLKGRTSVLNPLWYTGSFLLGAIAGKAGDSWSLGFVAETEKQVTLHLDAHLTHLSEVDARSRVVLEQMKVDEAHHGQQALEAGGRTLPYPIRMMMKAVSKVMTRSSYWF